MLTGTSFKPQPRPWQTRCGQRTVRALSSLKFSSLLKTIAGDTQTELGTTELPTVLAAIVKDALRCLRVPDVSHLPALYETLRVGANICVDHGATQRLHPLNPLLTPSADENRGHLLESGFLTSLVTLLRRYTDLIPSDKPTDFLPLSVAHLKVVRTAIGVLLNASLGYGASTWPDYLVYRCQQRCHHKEPVKTALNTAEAPGTILRLAVAIYPTSVWARSPQPLIPPGEFEESWQLRSGFSSWAWRVAVELKDDGAPRNVTFSRDPLFTIKTNDAFPPITQRRPRSGQISFRRSSSPSALLSRPFRHRCLQPLTRRPRCGAHSSPQTSRRSWTRARSSRRSRSTTKTCGSRLRAE